MRVSGSTQRSAQRRAVKRSVEEPQGFKLGRLRTARAEKGWLTRRLTYSNVVASLALFLALGGVGYAAAAWTGADIVDGSLTGADVHDNSLEQADLGTDSVAFDELAFNSVASAHIRDGAVGTADIANASLRSEDVASAFTAPNASRLGGLSPGSYEQRVRRVNVSTNANGNPYVNAGESDGLVSVSHPSEGIYGVRFDAAVKQCTPVATLANRSGAPTAHIKAHPALDDDRAVTVEIGQRDVHTTDWMEKDINFNLIVVC